MSMLRGSLQEFHIPFLNAAKHFRRTSTHAMACLTVATMLKFRESPIRVKYSLRRGNYTTYGISMTSLDFSILAA